MDDKIWYVRSEEGAVYGPASSASLLDWVRDGRVTPSGYVSKDRINRVSPQTLPEPEMKWLIETKLGKFFGLFHRDLVKRLGTDGSVPAGARIYCDREIPVDQDPAPAVVEKVVEKIVEAPPREAIVVPEVVEAIDAPPPRSKLGGIFRDTDPDRLAALEAEARKELSAARKFGIGGFFGRK